jgi:hypothetical protein
LAFGKAEGGSLPAVPFSALGSNGI